MKRIIVLGLVLFTFLVSAAWAKQPKAKEPDLVAIPLNILWRVVPREPDRMTTPGGEELQYPLEGQVFYVPADSQEPGTTTLYRYFNGPDHRDSTLAELPNYANEGPEGFPWTSHSHPGLSPMVEGFNPDTGDYALMQPGEHLPGYSTEGLNVFGFKRFYNQDESLLPLTKGNTTVESNRVFGGMVTRWTWNGMQFLNNLPLRGAASLVAFDIDGAYRQMHEGGGGWPHGSPLIRAQNNGTTQVTRSVPLDSTSGALDNPLLWRDVILGKNLTLDFNRMGPVARYTSYISLPAPIPSGALYHPLVNLRANFNRFFVYLADSDLLQEITPSVPDGCIADERYGTAPITAGGGIASDASGNYAFGVYTDSRSHIDSPDFVEFGRYVCWGEDSSEKSDSFIFLSLTRGGPLPAGESTYNSYVVTGTVNDVKDKMHQLYLMGAK